MPRNKMNTNQSIFMNTQFKGMDVLNSSGALIENNLNRAYSCLQDSLYEFSRVCMMRFDLHVPTGWYIRALDNNVLIGRFFASLKSKIHHSQARSAAAGHRVHDNRMRYVWCREITANKMIHYHVAIFLNHDAYAFMGHFDVESSNMYQRIHSAWASALNLHVEDCIGLIHIPRNPVYRINRDDHLSINEAFKRVSYLTKMETKEYGRQFHTFGASRNLFI